MGVYSIGMRQLVIDNTVIGENIAPYVIAEIGHNHQGKIDSAISLIHAAAMAGASAAKFQKRDNQTLFAPQLYNQVYNSENSFGETYGQHREALEFGSEEYKVCIAEARKVGITFFATAFDFKSADFLNALEMPAYKIASGDLQNLPLLKYVARFNKPMIISTGGATFQMIRSAVDTIRTVHNQVAILQCTASYPAKYEHLNLKVISKLRDMYPENVIGYSGHDNGIAMAVVAYTLGARIIEKHFTLNRTLKGTDHAFSLEPQGMQKMVRDLKRSALALGDGEKIVYSDEIAPIKKMGKMIIAARDLRLGDRINFEDLEFRSPAEGLPPSFADKIVGKMLKQDLKKYSPLTLEMFD
jgi:N-acetylneuraminate synthase/sialic acid synthase